jgi:hypothetical protein
MRRTTGVLIAIGFFLYGAHDLATAIYYIHRQGESSIGQVQYTLIGAAFIAFGLAALTWSRS